MTSLRGGKRFLLSAAVSATLFAAPSAYSASAPRVSLDQETLVGASSTELSKFPGVRYAEAPTGDRRWKPPVPAAVAT